jgi:hypothetical protein
MAGTSPAMTETRQGSDPALAPQLFAACRFFAALFTAWMISG